jgi:hypothetical protein
MDEENAACVLCVCICVRVLHKWSNIHTHTKKYYSFMQQCEDIMLCEVSQAQKDKCHMFPLTYGS